MDQIIIYTDGSYQSNVKNQQKFNLNVRMGLGIYFPPLKDNQEFHLYSSIKEKLSSTRAELGAILLALEYLPEDVTANIYTDSSAAISVIN